MSAIALLSLPLALWASPSTFPALRRPLPVASIATRMMAATPPAVEIVDEDGDEIYFCVEEGALKMFVAGEGIVESVQKLGYDPEDGTIAQGNDGFFKLRPEDQAEVPGKLRALAEAAGVTWGELEDEDAAMKAMSSEASESTAAAFAAVEDVVLPAAVEALLIDDELKASRPAVKVLWTRLLEVYESEAAALAAVAKNSAIVLPYLNRPFHIDGSWKILKQMMSEEEAREVITQNPGILSCNPAGLKDSNAADVKRAAAVVDSVEGLPMAARWAIPGALVAGAGYILVGGFTG